MAVSLASLLPWRLNSTLKGRTSFIKFWLPVIIYAIIIFSFSSLPGQDIPSLFNYQDVVFHLAEYAVLALLFNRAMKAYYPRMTKKERSLFILFYCFVYALSDEFHQFFIPNRSASLFDVAYDTTGVFIINLLYR